MSASHVFTLRSNDGDHWIQWRVTAFAKGGLIAEVTLRGVNFSADDRPEVTLTAKEVLIDSSRLQGFEGEVQRWVERSMDEQREQPLAAQFTLADGGSERLTLKFGPREDLLSGSNPIVTALYKFGRIQGEFCFLTDQTCLRSLCREIREVPAR